METWVDQRPSSASRFPTISPHTRDSFKHMHIQTCSTARLPACPAASAATASAAANALSKTCIDRDGTCQARKEAHASQPPTAVSPFLFWPSTSPSSSQPTIYLQIPAPVPLRVLQALDRHPARPGPGGGQAPSVVVGGGVMVCERARACVWVGEEDNLAIENT